MICLKLLDPTFRKDIQRANHKIYVAGKGFQIGWWIGVKIQFVLVFNCVYACRTYKKRLLNQGRCNAK